jgi:hypothetical protein
VPQDGGVLEIEKQIISFLEKESQRGKGVEGIIMH